MPMLTWIVYLNMVLLVSKVTFRPPKIGRAPKHDIFYHCF